jgi:hypothetical protein
LMDDHKYNLMGTQVVPETRFISISLIKSADVI